MLQYYVRSYAFMQKRSITQCKILKSPVLVSLHTYLRSNITVICEKYSYYKRSGITHTGSTPIYINYGVSITNSHMQSALGLTAGVYSLYL